MNKECRTERNVEDPLTDRKNRRLIVVKLRVDFFRTFLRVPEILPIVLVVSVFLKYPYVFILIKSNRKRRHN